jgi:NitT/TauT family transport system substrate-binding protein
MNRRTVIGLLAATGVAGWRGIADAQSVAIRAATVPIDSGAELYFGKELGFFDRAGLDVHVDTISSGSAIAAAVASGALDVGFDNVGSIAAAYKRGVPLTIIAPAGLYEDDAPTTALVVKKGSPISSARDLNGKTVAVNAVKNITQFTTLAWSDRNGGDPASLRFVEMPFPQMIPALAQDRVDAAVIAEPALTASKSIARVLGNSFGAIGKEYLIGGWFCTRSWAGEHPDVVRRFAEAMHATATWANQLQNRKRSAEILAKYAKLDLRVVNGMQRCVYGETLNAALMQPQIDISAKYGLLSAAFPARDLIFAAV